MHKLLIAALAAVVASGCAPVKVESRSDLARWLAPPGSADFVLTFRNLHNWIERNEVEGALRAFHRDANPKDTKDHPEGVWTLPPTYRLKDKDRAKYAAIGESDRFTLKFVRQ
jgi:hypothetical protein